MNDESRKFHLSLLIAALIAFTVLCYYHGLFGPFLFDDFSNLPALGSDGAIRDSSTFWRYISSGTADPTGRPIALLSFLLDARNWPAAPLSFKRTNLILHLLNGLLLLALLRGLGRQTMASSSDRRVALAALLGSGFWLLHPLFVSTTLYVVQREAMLPATFTLLGLLAWLHGRQQFRSGRKGSAWAWSILGLVACTLLAVLSKANGILLPALALTVEIFLLQGSEPAWPRQRRHDYQVAMILLAVAPTLCIAGYLVREGWHGLAHGISSVRPWTLGQRLLTEPRVLMDYLQLLWLPRPFTSGLFNDQYLASTSLWSPVTTLPALLMLAVLLAAAWRLRRRAPAVAVAIAFYFVGQSMESSTIALELYFEHRNYLPAMLMFWPLAIWLCGLPLVVGGTSHAGVRYLGPKSDSRLRAGLALVLLAGLALMTHARAELWGNTQDQALLWARLNPASPRAQAYAAQAEMAAGHPELAEARLRSVLIHKPDEVQLALNLLVARCEQGHLDDRTLAAAIRALNTTRDTGTLLTHWFGRAIDQGQSPACPEMNLSTVGRLLDAAQANPFLASTPGRRQDLYHLRGRIALAQHQPDTALDAFDTALNQQVRATAAFQQAALLGSAGYPTQGLAHLDHYEAVRSQESEPSFGMPRIHAWVLERQHYWDKELVRLRQTLRDDVRSHSTPSA
jgi:tetratricopeptide (TPR) repeat protein